MKIRWVGDFQPSTLSNPRCGLAPAGLHDGPALEQAVHTLPYQ